VPPPDTQACRPRQPRISGWRISFLVALLLCVAGAFILGVNDYLTFEEISRHREAVMAWRDRNPLLSVVAFIGIYASVVAISLPGAIWLTVGGGFLFGTVSGTVYSVVGATLGACGAFLATRYLAGDRLRARAETWIGTMDAGFRANAFNYMLVLRLLPVFPFWLVNVVPALLNVRLRTFLVGTLLGIIPGAVVYALLGNGLGAVIAAGEKPDLDIVFEPQVLAPIIGLALLSLGPVVYRRLRDRRAAASAPTGRP